MSRIRQILRFHTQGKSKKEISKLASSSRNTVKKYIHKFILERLTYEQIAAMTDHQLELLFGQIDPSPKDQRLEQLRERHEITATEFPRYQDQISASIF